MSHLRNLWLWGKHTEVSTDSGLWKQRQELVSCLGSLPPWLPEYPALPSFLTTAPQERERPPSLSLPTIRILENTESPKGDNKTEAWVWATQGAVKSYPDQDVHPAPSIFHRAGGTSPQLGGRGGSPGLGLLKGSGEADRRPLVDSLGSALTKRSN